STPRPLAYAAALLRGHRVHLIIESQIAAKGPARLEALQKEEPLKRAMAEVRLRHHEQIASAQRFRTLLEHIPQHGHPPDRRRNTAEIEPSAFQENHLPRRGALADPGFHQRMRRRGHPAA